MATGMKETWKVWESLPLEMEVGKERRKNVREQKRKKKMPQQQQKQCRQPAEAGWLGRFRKKKRPTKSR
jgi:hypothetical protein